jgi:uncharacterized protein (TIGR03435 family)
MTAAGAVVMKGQPAQEFEVASIKPSAPMAMGMMRVGVQMAPGGRLTTTGTSARFLIQQAYGVRDFQIVGGPAWLGSERYDITAKAAGPATPDQVKQMIQALLADRFKFQFHRETKELPTFALVVAKGGSKLKKAEVGDDGGEKKGGMMRMGRGMLDSQGIAMSGLANQLAQILGRSVIDKTELQGSYDIKLQWTPEEGEGGMMAQAAQAMHPEAVPDASGPTLMMALQDQLGLKLEATKGPVEIITVDRIEKPSEN